MSYILLLNWESRGFPLCKQCVVPMKTKTRLHVWQSKAELLNQLQTEQLKVRIKMEEREMLQNTLLGAKVQDDGNYVYGRFIGNIEDVVESFEAINGHNFSCKTSHSKRIKNGHTTAQSNIFFRQNSKGLIDIPFSGHPFAILSVKQWQCSFSTSIQTGTKRKTEDGSQNCPAFIKVRTARVYNENCLSNNENKCTRIMKENAKAELVSKLKTGVNVKYTDVHYCAFALNSAHNHTEEEDNGKSTRLDKQVIRKIKQLAKNGIIDPQNIKQLLVDYVENTLFCDIAQKPLSTNKRFYPSEKIIRNHIFLTVGALKKNPSYKRFSQFELDQSSCEPPTVVKSIPCTEDEKACKTPRCPKKFGIIAVHLGAGFHSPAKWPVYKKLCESACSVATQLLSDGLPAGEVVAKAVQILENSEYTNAGFGSNLSESGQVECDASLMDTTSDETGLCESYFGSIANVSCIRNPVLGAHAVLCAQRDGPRLPLGRVSPCFMGGTGAENWCRAHGVEMCEPDELKSESAVKSWKKYHKKLMEHYVTTAGGKGKCEDVTESDEENNNRLDTVGAIAMDTYGNTAAAVSSGGLLLKMPGRIGQAACYGCGCWAEKLDDGRAVALSTSGCGEQLIKVMLAQKCAQNLKSFEQPYEAIQSTLLNDFIASPALRLEENKHAGVLSIHSSQSDNDSIVEIVWGHTTCSMIIGHMSTEDYAPKVVSSRLPDSARAGGSVTVAGSWIKVSQTKKTDDEIEDGCSVDENSQSSKETNTRNALHEELTSLDGNADELEQDFNYLLNDEQLHVDFVSFSKNGIDEKLCETSLSENFNRKILSSHLPKEESLWNKKCTNNPRLFNGQKFRLHSIESNVKENKVVFNLGLTCYKDFIATNMLSSSFRDNVEKNTSGNTQEYMSDPLGVAAVVITTDNKVIMQKRSSWVGENPDMYDVPGGHAEPSSACDVKDGEITLADLDPSSVTHEIFDSELQEVSSEVNIPVENLSELMLLGVVRHLARGGRPVAYFAMRCYLSSTEIQQLYSKGGNETDESTHLLFIDEPDIGKLDEALLVDTCTNAKAALGLYLLLKSRGFQFN